MKITGITPCLWFDDQAEEAAQFYTSIFDDSKITKTTRYNDPSAKPSGKAVGSVMTVEFEIAGMTFVALNGGPHFDFSPAVSFQIHCDTQDEVDAVWEKLCDGGEEGRCGWLEDRFGLSWQIVPSQLPALLQHENAQKAKRVTEALMQMNKIDIAMLEQAAES